LRRLTVAGAVPANSFARFKTSSSIASVSLPVNVFCWLTWYEPINDNEADNRTSAP